MRRSGALLGLACGVAIAGQVFTAVAIGMATTRPDTSVGAWLPAALVLAVSVVALVVVVRGLTRRRPTNWPSRAMTVALPVGAAAGLGAGSALGLGVPQVVVVSIGLLIGVVTPAVLAYRAMRGLSAADTCTLDISYVTTLRRADRDGAPRWANPDEVTVDATEIAVVVRSGRIGAAHFRIPLAEVTEAVVHAAPTKRVPWLRLPSGEDLLIPPGGGDVVVIQHGNDTRVLPVFDPKELAEAIEARRNCNCRSTDHSAS